MRPLALLTLTLALASCLPIPTELIGKACDETHPCGGELFCVAGRCAASLPPEPVAPPHPQPQPQPQPHPQPQPQPQPQAAPPVVDAGVTCVPAASEDCSNGRDDDCDELADCLDPACAQRGCMAGNPAAVCCGTSCRDLSADEQSCGACGAACAPGQLCLGISTGAVVTGRCSCFGGGNNNCPVIGDDDQECVLNQCSCDDDDECSLGQQCTSLLGAGTPGVCHY